MKKLLSSFLALTMVVTAVPANVVSAADGQAQVVKAQNNKPAAAKAAAKKVISWANKAKTDIVAGCAALLLSLAAAFEANLHFKQKALKKEIEGLNEKLDGQNKNLDDQANKIKDQFAELRKVLESRDDNYSIGLKNLENSIFDTFNGKFKEENKELKEKQKNQPGVPTEDDLLNNEYLNGFLSGLNMLLSNEFLIRLYHGNNGRGLSTFVKGLGTIAFLAMQTLSPIKYLINNRGKIWNGTKYYTEKGWNSTSTFFGNLLYSNSTSTNNEGESIFSPTPTPSPSPLASN